MGSYGFGVSQHSRLPGAGLDRCLHRPVPSPDGCFLAAVVSETEVHIINLLEASPGNRVAKVILFPQSMRTFLQDLDIIRWSPESIMQRNGDVASNSSMTGNDHNWILLAGDRRLVVLRLDFSTQALINQVDDNYKSNVVVDVEFPEQLGRITSAEFVSGGSNVFLLFDMNIHGSFLSLTNADRTDLKGVKFTTEQGYASSPTGRYFAVLQRQNSQDYVLVFDFYQEDYNPTTFSAGLNGVQGIRWSPDGKPVLMVWESAAFGAQIKFFTGLGHPLQLLDLKCASFINSTFADSPGSGISAVAWSRQGGSSTHTVLAVGDGSKQVTYRCQKTQSLSIDSENTVIHPETVNSSECTIWQEHDGGEFQNVSGVVETHSDTTQDVELVSISADGGMFATRITSAPRTFWIWRARHNKPSFVIFLLNDIKQLLWHPSLAGILTIITKNKLPSIHVWYDKEKPPVTGQISLSSPLSTSGWRGRWASQKYASNSERQLFMISSTKQFQVGNLGVMNSQLCFESILDKDLLSKEEPTMMFDTPSKPSRAQSQTVTGGLITARTQDDVYWFSDVSRTDDEMF